MSEDALRKIALQVRNWGKWGPDDELGTLNYITPDTIAAACRLAPREVHGVQRHGGAVENEGEEVHRDDVGVGAKYPRFVRDVVLARVTCTTMGRQAPSRFGFFDVYPSEY